jgi:transposase
LGVLAERLVLVSRFQVLSDAQWSLIEGMLPRPTGRPGRRFSDARLMVEGIVYRYRTGIAWRDLPEVFGPWQTVWTWLHRMAIDGAWDRALAKLTAAADAAGLVDWSLSVDSTIARAHQHATNTTRHRGLDRITRIRSSSRPITASAGPRGGLSTKIHQLVDGNELPLVTLITPGQAGDSPMFLPAHGAAARRQRIRSAADSSGRGPRRQGVLVPRYTCAPALARDQGRDPRA